MALDVDLYSNDGYLLEHGALVRKQETTFIYLTFGRHFSSVNIFASI